MIGDRRSRSRHHSWRLLLLSFVNPFGYKDGDDAVDAAPFDYVVDGPWVVTIDDFLTNEECLHLIQFGYDIGYKRTVLEEGKDYNEDELAIEVGGGEEAEGEA